MSRSARFCITRSASTIAPGIDVVARTSGDPRLWVQPFERAMRGLGLKMMIQPVTFQRWMDLTLLTQRIATGCAAGLSALGLLLAVIGLFGIVSYSISERRKEFGIRVALGAQPWHLQKMVLRQTGATAVAGISFGILLGIAATVIFQSQFYGIGAVEWTVLVPVAAAMLSVCLLVSYVSARPWIKVDPMKAVRHL